MTNSRRRVQCKGRAQGLQCHSRQSHSRSCLLQASNRSSCVVGPMASSQLHNLCNQPVVQYIARYIKLEHILLPYSYRMLDSHPYSGCMLDVADLCMPGAPSQRSHTRFMQDILAPKLLSSSSLALPQPSHGLTLSMIRT